MVVALVAQMGASLQPHTVDSLVALWGREMDDSCFFACVLLYWVETDGGLSICADNDENCYTTHIEQT